MKDFLGEYKERRFWMAVGYAAMAGATAYSGYSQTKATNEAAEEAASKNAQALAEAKAAEAGAESQAKEAVKARKRAQTQTTYTSPLGVGTEATVAKKKLLGE
jgi:hypothetical protein